MAFPIEDCQSFAFEIANAIKLAGIMASEHFEGLRSVEDRMLYQKGIWIRGHEMSDPYFQPPTQTVLMEALTKAKVGVKLIPSDHPMVELIIGTQE